MYTYDETWPSVNKAKGVSLTGSLPVLEIDDQRLYQVRAPPIFREPHTCTDCARAPSYQPILNIDTSILPFSDIYPAVLAHTMAKQIMRNTLLMRYLTFIMIGE